MGTRAGLLALLASGCVMWPYHGQRAEPGEEVIIEGYADGPGHQILVEYYTMAPHFYYNVYQGQWLELAVVTSSTTPTWKAGAWGPDSPALYPYVVGRAQVDAWNWSNWSNQDRRKLRVTDLTADHPLLGGVESSATCFLSASRALPFNDRAVGCGYDRLEIDVCASGVPVDADGSCWEICGLGTPYCVGDDPWTIVPDLYRPYTP
jgi:hypothetical protein